MISKACVVGTYQRKLEEIAQCGIELTLIVPPVWKDPSGPIRLERVYTSGYKTLVEPMQFNGNFHLHDYPTLDQRLREIHPDVVHIDEEPYNRATWHALRSARRIGAKTLFFSWQNLVRRYPPPFSWWEREVLDRIDYGIMGTESAAEIWRAKGYRGPYAVIPQFGIDPDFFSPLAQPLPSDTFRIGYAGRLVPEKGVHLLLEALRGLSGNWQLEIVGQGPERERLQALTRQYGLEARVNFTGQVPSTALPELYHRLDVLVIPSLTQPNWKEQFGRVIVEANACAVPVIGSDCGAIPDVIGVGGVVFPEGDVAALRERLTRLMQNALLRHALGQAGREQALAKFTHAQVAAQTVEVYQKLVAP